MTNDPHDGYDFAAEVAAIYAALLAGQVPPDPEIEGALSSADWESLYEN